MLCVVVHKTKVCVCLDIVREPVSGSNNANVDVLFARI